MAEGACRMPNRTSRASVASETRERSAPAKRLARERSGESEGRSPSEREDLLQGTLDLIVLQMLRARPANGWELLQRITVVSNEVLAVNAGSLYPSLYRLEGRGWIASEWRTTENNRRAKVYRVTAAGRRQLAAERRTWARFAGARAAVLQTG